jgi:error-prone DNA polymerase
LREEIAREIVGQRGIRQFASIEDLKLRVPAIQKSELAVLAEVGALNFIAGKKNKIHRRDALWQVERAARRAGPLFEAEALSSQTDAQSEDSSGSAADVCSPLLQMNSEERLVADFRGTGMTVGPHPMAYHRGEMKRRGICSAIELRNLPDGAKVRVGGAVIARQRPGTAKGFVFLSLEDETGIANAIITPQLFEEDHAVVVQHPFLLIEGKLQNQEGVVSVKAERVRPLSISRAETTSHDFH